MRLALLLIVLVAACLRVAAAAGDFWLDEIFTYQLARAMDSPWDVLRKIRVEHHLLLTLSMYVAGDRPNWLWYRLLPVAAGTATVPLAGVLAARHGRAEALLAAWLTAMSYVLIHYSSEARGYAPAAFFAVLAAYTAGRYQRSRTWSWAGCVWTSLSLAFLSHPCTLFVLLGLLAAGAAHCSVSPRADRAWRLRDLLALYGPPGLFILAIYVLVMRRWSTIGGDVFSPITVIREALSLAWGLPAEPPWVNPGATVSAALLLGGLWYVYRTDRATSWAFHVMAIVAAPALFLAVARRQYLYVRYFVVSFPFFYLLAARLLAALLRGRAPARAAGLILLLVYTAGNIHLTSRLLTLGRGRYRDAMVYLARHTAGAEIEVGSDHDFRNRMVLDFYRRFLPSDKRLVYRAYREWPPGGPAWLITHSTATRHTPKPVLQIKGQAYTLRQSFPFAGLSGFHWHLYENDRTAATSGRAQRGGDTP